MVIAEDILRIAQAMPDYDIERELGRGGMGVVFLGRHRRLRRGAAIKELPPSIAVEDEVRERFVTEAQTLAGLAHPHIVPIFDYVERDGECLIVMQELPGGSVWDRFTSEGLTPPTACAVVMACCAALQHAHDNGVLHLDVKPDNLMFDAESAVKVTDFGISRMITGGRTLGTVDGQVLGTPAYMSPEQARGEDLTAASDVYAAGVMLYELLSGHLPWQGAQTAAELLQQRLDEDPIPLRDVVPSVPQPLHAVVMKALSRDLPSRFDRAEDFGVAIGEACAEAWGPGWIDHAGVRIVGSERMSMAARTTGHIAGAVRPSADAVEPVAVLDLTDARATGAPGAVAAPSGAHETGTGAAVRPAASAAPATGAAGPAAAPATGAVPPASALETGAFRPSAPPTEGQPPVAPSAPAVDDDPPADPPPAADEAPPAPPPELEFTAIRASSSDPRISGADLYGLELADLINVRDVLNPPRTPWRPVLVTALLFALALLVALIGLGNSDREGTLEAGQVIIDGVDVRSGERIDLDLSEDVIVEVLDRSLADAADEIEITFSYLGIGAPGASGALRDGRAVIEPGLPQRAVGGAVEADVRVLSRDDVVAHQEVGARATQAPYLTGPFAVGLLLILLAYAELESSLKPLRSGHTRIRSYIGAAIWTPVALVGLLLVMAALGRNELTEVDVVAVVALGVVGGATLVRSRIGVARRRRVRTAVKRAEKRVTAGVGI
ncbi:serine/threonine protein kinase [Acidimicrobiia bacterium EGI L10123]|uniref:serine/threonine-protein kinase n=1 Tax=Salinilacustrithrix flava TaxID=2957203 RepID=UPI003D7C2E53|nr:serine/threonine protein kinase [Acidimicrobiia bacterium EGI L10123]